MEVLAEYEGSRSFRYPLPFKLKEKTVSPIRRSVILNSPDSFGLFQTPSSKRAYTSPSREAKVPIRFLSLIFAFIVRPVLVSYFGYGTARKVLASTILYVTAAPIFPSSSSESVYS